MELIHPSSTDKKDCVIARMMAACSCGEWVPAGAPSLATPTDAEVFTDVLTEDTDRLMDASPRVVSSVEGWRARGVRGDGVVCGCAEAAEAGEGNSEAAFE